MSAQYIDAEAGAAEAAATMALLSRIRYDLAQDLAAFAHEIGLAEDADPEDPDVGALANAQVALAALTAANEALAGVLPVLDSLDPPLPDGGTI